MKNGINGDETLLSLRETVTVDTATHYQTKASGNRILDNRLCKHTLNMNRITSDCRYHCNSESDLDLSGTKMGKQLW